MDKVVQQVINQFPDRESHIQQLWQSDEDFQELCLDYVLCLKTIAHWSAENTKQKRVAEYLSLRRQLELEIEIKTQKFQSRKAEL